MKKNASTFITYWLVIFLPLLSFLPFPAHAMSTESSSALLAHQLQVDTLLDFNDLSYQVCSAAPADCSLRGAISKANLDLQHLYELNLPAGTYLLSISGAFEDANTSGDLDVLGSLRLVGAGAVDTIISSQELDRVLQVFQDASLTLQGLTLSGGKTPDGEPHVPGDPETSSEDGGGLHNAGYLLLVDSVVQGNQTGPGGAGIQETKSGGSSGNGGGIFNSGWLIVDHSTITNNRTGKGGDASPTVGCSGGGTSGHGGGIYNTGRLLLKDSQVASNFVPSGGAGGVGWKFSCSMGESGSGGGVYNTFIMQVHNSQVNLNLAGSAGVGLGKGGDGGGIYSTGRLEIDASQVDSNLAGGGGPAGQGGGIASSGKLKVSHSQITANASGDGYPGLDPVGGAGGGIFSSGEADISDSLIADNRTGRGGYFYSYVLSFTWGGVQGGSGGGIASMGSLVLDNTTIQGNQTGPGGDGGGYGDERFSGGDGGPGGGLYNAGTAHLWNSPISSNVTGAGGKALGYLPEDYLNGSGGAGGSGAGIYNFGNLTLWHSPVANNTAGTGGVGDAKSGTGGSGGGIYNAGVLATHFSAVTGNTAGTGCEGYSGGTDGVDEALPGPGGSGGGIYNAGVLASRFSAVTGNTAGTGGSDEISPGGKGGDGGGIYNDANMVALGSWIVQNQAGSGGSPASPNGDGGGIFLSENGVLELTSAVVAENQVQEGAHGSGMRLNNYATLLHTTLAGNHGGDGSGVYFAGPSLTLTNSIIVAHTVGIFAEEGIVYLNSTLWGSGEWANVLDYDGGDISTISDLYGEPDFVDPANGDYHLLPTSPAIDQGIQTSATQDIDNQPLPNPASDLADLGADEYWQIVPLSGVTLQWQPPVSTNIEVTLIALASPLDVTPNLVYNWSPYPESGQGTAHAVYRWPLAGTYPVSVTVSNAGSRVTASALVNVQFGPQAVFLPVIQNH